MRFAPTVWRSAVGLVGLVVLVGAVRAEPTTDDDDATPATPLVDTATLQNAYRAEPDEKRRAALVQAISARPGTRDFLAKIIAEDPSDSVALLATYAFRRATLGNVVELLDRRLQTGARDDASRSRLLREMERHQFFAAGQGLPHFLREAPPVFTVKGSDRASVRVLAFGDFGTGDARQAETAEAMRRQHGKKRFDFAITLGDNFYPGGMRGPDDPRWEKDFVKLYGALNITFLPSLGNHDWALADSPAAEILYAQKSKLWRMPADRYTFVAGPVQFFAIDTNLVSRAQLAWLDAEIGRSTARWKIVYGHHPIRSYGVHGDEPGLREALMPLLRGRVDLYLCGHEHDLQHIAPEEGVHFVVAGGGGALPRRTSSGPSSLFAASKNGFAVIEASRTSLTVSLVGTNLETLHRFSLPEPRKGEDR